LKTFVENTIDISVRDTPILSETIQTAVKALRDRGIRVAAAATINDSQQTQIGRILLQHAIDKPRAIQILASLHIQIR